MYSERHTNRSGAGKGAREKPEEGGGGGQRDREERRGEERERRRDGERSAMAGCRAVCCTGASW